MLILALLGCLSSSDETKQSQALETAKADVNGNPRPPGQGPRPSPSNPVPGGPQGQPPSGLKAAVNFQWSGTARDTLHSIVLISLDTVQADRLEVYGGRAKTPNLSKLATRGIVFEQAISHFPETALSHWAMMTSVLPEVHGNVPANGGSRYSGPTLAEIAKHHGYATGAFIGGVTMTDRASGFSRGFDVYDDQFPVRMEDMSRDGRQVTARAKKWIASQQGPYFAFLHYFDAHFPYTPKPPWDTLYDPDYNGSLDGTDAVLRPYRDGEKTPSQRDVEHILALYDGEISELDAKIKSVLEAVDNQTIVVVTSDHGESFSHGYYFNHRAGLWDEITHVPLLIAGPGVSSGRISQQVGLIDLLPTVLDLAGLPTDKRMQGQSALPLIQGKEQEERTAYSITDPWMANPQFAARTSKWKWIKQLEANLVYHLATDPEERATQKEVPTLLVSAQEKYTEQIEGLSAYQVEVTSRRTISEDECQRLMALGYTTCEQ